jgi:spore coat protein U-like protein
LSLRQKFVSSLCLLATVALPSFAAPLADMDVTADVGETCAVYSAAMHFGNYDPVVAHLNSSLNAVGSVDLRCTTGSGAVITLDQGSFQTLQSTPFEPIRRMINLNSVVGGELVYFLYQDSERSMPWGEQESGRFLVGSGLNQSLAVYGTIPAGQNVPAGFYADTVVVSVIF